MPALIFHEGHQVGDLTGTDPHALHIFIFGVGHVGVVIKRMRHSGSRRGQNFVGFNTSRDPLRNLHEGIRQEIFQFRPFIRRDEYGDRSAQDGPHPGRVLARCHHKTCLRHSRGGRGHACRVGACIHLILTDRIRAYSVQRSPAVSFRVPGDPERIEGQLRIGILAVGRAKKSGPVSSRNRRP